LAVATTIGDIRNDDPAACTLLLGATSPALMAEAMPQQPAPVAPRAENRYTRQQDLETAMARAIASRRR
jgi:hypothetical protein